MATFLIGLAFGCLLLVRIVWLLTDPRTLKEIIFWYLKPKIFLLGLLDVVFLVIVIYSLRTLSAPETLFQYLVTFFGIILCGLGTAIAIWAKLTMRSAWAPAGEDPGKRIGLVIDGPFEYSRNPVYVGLRWLFLVIFAQVIYFYRAVLKEEPMLSKKWGKKYLDYKACVPRFL